MVAALWATGPVCITCYHRASAAKAICGGCGELRRPDPRDLSGKCSDCLGLAPFQVCTRCGTEDRIYRHGHCYACELVDAVHALLGPSNPDRLQSLRQTLVSTDRPRAVLHWLDTAIIRDAMARLADGTLELSHSAIDTLGDGLAVTRFRAVLVTTGLLEQRNDAIARLELWVKHALDQIHAPEHRQLLDAFAHWQVIRRTRQLDERITVNDTNARRAQISRAIELLQHLDDRGRSLADCRQADIDQWIAASSSRREVRFFLKWAHQRGRCPQLIVAHRKTWWPTRSVQPEDQQAVIDRLLADNSIRVADRVAGMFVACYGQLPARIVRLTTDDITITPDDVCVRFGNDELNLPRPIATLVRDLVHQRRGKAAITTVGDKWLFPGGLAGRPLHAATLRNRLLAIGLDAKRFRTAALLDLATEVPPMIIADMIGLHQSAAARWTRAAGGDWAAYVASKTLPDQPASS